ncbi:MAG TPA: DEAD/DEAH box helicase family protein [Gammaproteobacteria bacterium]|nr:DEAD/DEAH box helicase family protein [Gammaproteobacteria bacterium]
MAAGHDDELARLRAENARLIGLLEAHGIAWRPPAPGPAAPAIASLSTDEKLALFRRLFRGRSDVYPIRWESKAGKSGYAPACANEWKPGICEKPRIKCADCRQRLLMPLTDQVIFDHLAGRHVIGVYPLLADDGCHFLAVDFDDADWRDDVRAFVQSCRELDVPLALEISRSGNGAHVWIFFSDRVAARDARRLGSAIISHTCQRTRQLKLTSYDRLFPNQDTLPKGGFGNLIALPLQKAPRERGASVFVDDALQAHADQWAFLASVRAMAPHDIEPAILRATGGAHPLDVTFATEEDLREPWRRKSADKQRLAGPMPASLTLTLANLVYVEKASLPQALTNRLIRLAAFRNPEFHQAQALRLPVWNKPRLIGCAENFPHHIALPRGCLDAARELLDENGIGCELRDERCGGLALDVEFAGRLRPDQEQAAGAMLRHDIGILCAPTAFGKTVTAAALIARRGVNALVLVHRTELLEQWQTRLQTFLDGEKDLIGVIGAGKFRPTGRIDIAVMQSLSRQGEANALVESYGHVIVDECHHLSAFSFETILKRVRARYVLGLTATPTRRDGRQPILFMQCGPIRHTAAQPAGAPQILEVVPCCLPLRASFENDAAIQEVFRLLAGDEARTAAIADKIAHAFERGGKVLVLTERTDHLDALHAALRDRVSPLFVLHGRLSRTQRASVMVGLDALDADGPRVLLATGRLIGEGFDHAPLDTLVLAMPVSWKGTLQQYAGRLHRQHAGKRHVRILDFIDTGHPTLLRMWERRQRGYHAMGYRLAGGGTLDLESRRERAEEFAQDTMRE